jgi:GR25 family glycosyltransferase involved in LPS biosynthesis
MYVLNLCLDFKCVYISIFIVLVHFNMKNINIYFIHSNNLPARDRVIEDLRILIAKHSFKDYKINSIRIIGEYDPQMINMDVIQKSVDYNPIQEEELKVFNQLLRNIHVNQLSNALKHHKAMEYISTLSGDDDVNIILEDDVLFVAEMPHLLEQALSQFKKEHDLVFLGLPINKEPPANNKIVVEAVDPMYTVLPLCDSYIISTSCASKLHAQYLPIKFPNNIHLSYIMKKLSLNAQQTRPNVFVDGTKYGVFPSSLTINNPLIFNREFLVISNMINKPTELTKDEIKAAEQVLASSPVKDNHEFVYLRAKLLMKMKKMKEAEESFEKAYDTALKCGCIVNHESVFLKDFIRYYKEIQ